MLLNLDAGELPDEPPDLWAQFDILNIACGGHAGDTASMTRVAQFAIAHSIAIGAHPSYPDRDHFGRRSLSIAPEELHASLVSQLRSLSRIALGLGARVQYAKPHGALYHDASRDPALAVLVVDAIEAALERVTIIGPRGHLASAARAAGLPYAVEGFADRAMRPDASLVPRTEPNALITSPSAAAAQALSLSNVDTICVHADTPGALDIARAVRTALTRASNASASNARDAPTASAPASNAPTSNAPATNAPAANAPARSSAQAPASNAPAANAPARSSAQAPAPNAPATNAPARSSAQAPASNAPATNAPARSSAQAPASNAPATNAPARSSAQAPASNAPATNAPARSSFVALGDRAIRFSRPPASSSRALVDTIKRWPGVVDVVVARREIAAYFGRPIIDQHSSALGQDSRHATGVSRESPASELVALEHAIAALANLGDLNEPARKIELRATYDGEDLAEVARACGLTAAEVIDAHVGATYEVDTLGFAPGFAYLVGLDSRLHIPRRSTPRARVPAGALAIAGEYTAVYPFASPGGWHLIGRVDAKLFDPDRGARLQLGDRVTFSRAR